MRVGAPTTRRDESEVDTYAEFTGEGDYDVLRMYTFKTFADLEDEGAWVGFIVPADAMPPIPELPAE